MEGLEHARLDPLARELPRDAEPSPSRRSALGSRSAGDLQRGRVAGVAARPCGAASAPRPRRRASAGPPGPARRRRRSSRSARPSRRSASGRRCRTSRPAGGSSRRCRCRAPTGPGPPPPPRRCRPRSRRARARGPRGCGRPECGVLVRGAHRELVLVGLGEQRRARLGQLAHGGRRVRRQVALEDPRAGLARHALGAEQVLDGERALPRSAPPAAAVRRPSGATHVKQFSPCSPGRAVGCGAGAVGLEQLAGGQRARVDRGGRGRGRQLEDLRARSCLRAWDEEALVADGGRLREHDLARQATAAAHRRAARRSPPPRGRSAGRPSRSSSPIRAMWSRTADSSRAIGSISSSASSSRARRATCSTSSRSITVRAFYVAPAGDRRQRRR